MKVAIIMGSSSDYPVMQPAEMVLETFAIPFETRVVSAHRSPEQMFAFASQAAEEGFDVIIAGAGGAAHLPGMVASLTTLPVIGVPVLSKNSLDGWDSLLSMVQMPNDVPVATVAINGAHNAGLLAVKMLSIGNYELRQQLVTYRQLGINRVAQQNSDLKKWKQ